LQIKKELYYTFFIVGATVRRKIFSVVGHAEIPVASQKFPLFRFGIFNLAGKVEHWSLWDGEKEWMVGRLTDEQLDLPIRSIWTDQALVYSLEQGWTPRKSEALIQAARLKAKVKKSHAVIGVRHFLLYRSKQLARSGQELVEKSGFKSELLETDETVMLIVQQSPPYTEEYVESTTMRLAEIADKSHGSYDCWETELG
jgi:Regulator of ribonuclease activity B